MFELALEFENPTAAFAGPIGVRLDARRLVRIIVASGATLLSPALSRLASLSLKLAVVGRIELRRFCAKNTNTWGAFPRLCLHWVIG